MEPQRDDHHLPGPSLWPVGFAVGVAATLVGLVISWVVTAVGAAIALVFAFLWIRELSVGRGVAAEAEPAEGEAEPEPPSGPPLPALAGGPAMPHAERYPRSKFLEVSTLGLGAVIGGVVTVPALGFAIAPAFLKQGHPTIDIGPLSDYPQGQYIVATFMENPGQGEVSRRTAYVRNNGLLSGQPSFTIISNRCTHLGCPVQPGGPIFDAKKKTVKSGKAEVTLIPTTPAGGFLCPCHGSAFDQEGNRVAGPAARALDRWTFAIVNGRLRLEQNYSVSHVIGSGADAKIYKYELAGPGQHVDGPEFWFYPVQAPH